MITKLHRATHLLHQALRSVLGSHVAQKGSNITVERPRFDFSYSQPMTEEEMRKVEAIDDDQIVRDLLVSMGSSSSRKSGLFGEKYHRGLLQSSLRRSPRGVRRIRAVLQDT
jgi:alanyl-tRNA synthetase